jgi:hypothetical protein
MRVTGQWAKHAPATHEAAHAKPISPSLLFNSSNQPASSRFPDPGLLLAKGQDPCRHCAKFTLVLFTELRVSKFCLHDCSVYKTLKVLFPEVSEFAACRAVFCLLRFAHCALYFFFNLLKLGNSPSCSKDDRPEPSKLIAKRFACWRVYLLSPRLRKAGPALLFSRTPPTVERSHPLASLTPRLQARPCPGHENRVAMTRRPLCW